MHPRLKPGPGPDDASAMTPCPRCGRILTAFARRGHVQATRRDPAAAARPWLALHVGDGGTSECRVSDDEATAMLHASAVQSEAA